MNERQTNAPPPGKANAVLRSLQMERDETRRVGWSFLYFFSLLCGYYILRPLREEMAIRAGVEQLHWLFTATFVVTLVLVPLFALLVSRVPRRIFLPVVYGFVISSLAVFFVGFVIAPHSVGLARGFYVWVSVFNLFAVSVFWSFMADLYEPRQAKRLFGLIAAGGTAGAIAGPALTASLVTAAGTTGLLPISAAFLAVALVCIRRLLALAPQRPRKEEQTSSLSQVFGGSMLAGFRMLMTSRYLQGICLLILLYSSASTFLYFTQAHIISASIADSDERTRIFALIDLAVNVLTIGTQMFATSRIAERAGVGVTLSLIPALLAAGFLLLGIAPVLPVLIGVQVLRRAGNYAVMKPAREMLFTVLTPVEKYKAKNLIDTVVYRGGDALSAWLYAGMRGLGLDVGTLAFASVPLCLLWMVTGLRLGRAFTARQRLDRHNPHTASTADNGLRSQT